MEEANLCGIWSNTAQKERVRYRGRRSTDCPCGRTSASRLPSLMLQIMWGNERWFSPVLAQLRT
ncbi:hypothetical protein BT69DRAFT_591147 [Atractiella rhizophila]|nr:hypothetical protein BT69DRAFT_591147 [Atractiella rhizophila]